MPRRRARRAWGAAYINSNRNKRSLCLDLKQPEAHAALMRLIAGRRCLRPQPAPAGDHPPPPPPPKLGLDYASVEGRAGGYRLLLRLGLWQRRPPMPGDPAYDDVIQAASGVAGLVGAHRA